MTYSDVIEQGNERFTLSFLDWGVFVLVVEQNVRSSLKLADRGYVLESGRITMSGTGKELLEDENIKKAYLGG